MVQHVINTYNRIRQVILAALGFVRSKITQIMDFILNQLVIWMVRHYERDLGYC